MGFKYVVAGHDLKGFPCKWHLHLPQKNHQDLAMKELAGWDANLRAKLLVFINLPVDNDIEILNQLSDHGKIVIADFALSSEARPRIGMVQFETREELLKVLSGLESKDDQFYIEGSWCEVRDGGVITQSEYNTWLQSLLGTKERENSKAAIGKILEACKEEKERLEREQKRKEDEMLSVANQAVLQMKTTLPSAIENWLRNHFHGRNIEEIKNIYSHSLRVVQEEGHKTVNALLWKALDQKIDAKCRDYYMDYLTDLQNRMQTFYRQVKKKFEYHDCFTVNELDKLCTGEYPKVSRDLESSDPQKHHLLEIGCKMIGDYVYEQNAKIIANEERLAKKLMPMVLRYYNEEMTRFTQEGVYAPNNLKEIHSNLIARWVEGFRKSFKLTATGKTSENVEYQLKELKASLVQGFQKHLQHNNKNLERMQQQIAKIIEASKKSYVEKIEDVLNKNSDGLELRELTKRQQDIVNEAKVLLKMEIKQKIRQDEPLEAHVKSLQAYMDNYWKVVVGANSKNLQKRNSTLNTMGCLIERLDRHPRRILIYALGCGTLDVVVLDMQPNKVEVLGVKGHTHLGGEDFDERMMEHCAISFKNETGLDLLNGKDSTVKGERDDARRRLRRLQTYCEMAKQELASARTAQVSVDAIIDGLDLTVDVTRKKFDELNMAYFEKSIQMVEETLKDVGLRKEDINDVVLVGGSSRIPKVQEMLSSFFGGKALNKSIHPDYAVA